MKSFKEVIQCQDFFTVGVSSDEDERCRVTLTDTYSNYHESMAALLTLGEVKELHKALGSYLEYKSY